MKAFFGKKRVLVSNNCYKIERYCTNCGKKVIPPVRDPYDYSYCPFCGAEIFRRWENEYNEYSLNKDPNRTKSPMAWTAMKNEEEGNDGQG